MRHEARALHELHTLLHRAEDLGISRAVRIKLVGIIGELEAEELERYRAKYGLDEGRVQQVPAPERGRGHGFDARREYEPRHEYEPRRE